MTKKLKSKVFIPENYKSNLSLIETEIAIKKVKEFFEAKLAETLNLTREFLLHYFLKMVQV